LGVVCSGLLLFLAFRKVDLQELGAALRRFPPRHLPGLALLVVLDLDLRAFRWRLLLPRSPGVSAGACFRLEAVGLAINNILPLRIGELARTLLAARRFGMPFLAVLASIAVERILDLLTLLGLLLYLGDWGGALGWASGLRVWAHWAFPSLVAALGALAWLGKAPSLPRVLAPLQGWIEQFSLGTRALRSWTAAPAVAGLGLLLWLTDGLMFLYAGRAMGLEGMGFPLSVVCLVAAAASTALPAVPGYFGAYEFAVSRVLLAAGVPSAPALGLAALVHLMQFAVSTGLGLAFLYLEGLSPRSLSRELAARRGRE